MRVKKRQLFHILRLNNIVSFMNNLLNTTVLKMQTLIIIPLNAKKTENSTFRCKSKMS